ncbi:MAG TPA: DsbA family oxidoreductase [Solirubrobacteraceae bacterium]|nr:DsbA family oxidoreductase [Solirubrobacteraceae bacterium]
MEVEIWSDIACPWCYIGKRRFEAALAEFEHADEVHVTWRSFELDPSAPHERPGNRSERIAEKYGVTVEQARTMEQRVTDAAAGERLEFRFDIARSGVTFDGHRLIHIAAAHGLQDAMKERLMRAYFSEGQLISDRDTLARLAGEVGLDPNEVHEQLESDRYSDEVHADERDATALGISAVPTFVVDRQLGVSGAQPPEVMMQLLRKGWEQRAPQPTIVGGEACSVDGC